MRKLTKEQVEEIKKLYSEGRTQVSLALQFKVSQAIIQYHVNEKAKIRIKLYIKNWLKLNGKRYADKKREYQRNYYKNKYKTDEVFREKEKLRLKQYVTR